jgi:hypothetical protein
LFFFLVIEYFSVNYYKCFNKLFLISCIYKVFIYQIYLLLFLSIYILKKIYYIIQLIDYQYIFNLQYQFKRNENYSLIPQFNHHILYFLFNDLNFIFIKIFNFKAFIDKN